MASREQGARRLEAEVEDAKVSSWEISIQTTVKEELFAVSPEVSMQFCLINRMMNPFIKEPLVPCLFRCEIFESLLYDSLFTFLALFSSTSIWMQSFSWVYDLELPAVYQWYLFHRYAFYKTRDRTYALPWLKY